MTTQEVITTRKSVRAYTPEQLTETELSAWDMELGAVFNWAAGTILPEKAELLAELGVDEAFKPLAGVVIGHPAKDVPARVKKVSMETNFIR